MTEKKKQLTREQWAQIRESAKEYKGAETENFVPENKLTPERQAELTEHFHQCEVPFLTCPLCHELYSNIGYQEYKKLCELYPEDMDLV